MSDLINLFILHIIFYFLIFEICRLWFSTLENKISQLEGLRSISITVFICFKIISNYLVDCFVVSTVYIRENLQAMILQAMILGFFWKFCRLWFLTPKNKISQPNELQSISITVYQCFKVISIYLIGYFDVSIVCIRKNLQAMIFFRKFCRLRFFSPWPWSISA